MNPANANAIAGYPVPPPGMPMPQEWQLYLTIVFGIFAAISWGYAIWLARRNRDIVPILVMLGGGIAVLAEAPVDILGMCYWADIGQWTIYETFGRKIPVITLFAYTTFYGGVVVMTLNQFRNGISYGSLWKWFWIWTIMEFLWEPIPIHYGVWMYYGEQPFRVFDFPIWWPPVNAAGAYAAAFLIHKILPHLKGPSLLLLLPAVASGDLAGNAIVAWPIWAALNSTAGYSATIPAGILTIVLCMCFLHYVAKDVDVTRR